jgi:hypothetical protein
MAPSYRALTNKTDRPLINLGQGKLEKKYTGHYIKMVTEE